MKEIEIEQDVPTLQTTRIRGDSMTVFGPGRRFYHSTRADIFMKTAQICLTKGDKVGYYRNMKEVSKHRQTGRTVSNGRRRFISPENNLTSVNMRQ